MTSCKPIATPMEQNVKLRADVGDVLEDPTMYRKIVGSFIYATLTQPDMSHDVGVLSQFMQVYVYFSRNLYTVFLVYPSRNYSISLHTHKEKAFASL